MTLDDLEHRILRPTFKDARIHFAVNCASVSGPPLGTEPYRPATLDARLDAAGKRFLSSPEGLKLTGDTLDVSSIFKWYGDDFIEQYAPLVPGDRDESLLEADPPLMEDVQTGSRWSLADGRAVTGPLAGARLDRAPAYPAFWFGWLGYSGDRRLAGGGREEMTNDRERIATALLALRLGVFMVMLMWTLDKFVNPGHASAVFENFYGLAGVGSAIMTAVGVAELLLVLAFAVGSTK